MNRHMTAGLGLIAGIGIGAVAVQALHAQAKPPAFFIAEVTPTNPDAYLKEFVPTITKSQQDYGAKYLAQGGKTISILGEPPKSRVVVIQFETLDKIQAWLNSTGYKDAQAIGNKYATFRTFAVEGVSQ